MKPKGSIRSTTRNRQVRRWRLALGIFLSLAIAFGAYRFWKASAPPPPAVDTTGYDPAIAAAIQDAREAARRSPRSAAARGRLGMVLLAHQIRREAGECFVQASQMSRDPRWPYFLGLTQTSDNPAAAVTNLDRAVRLFPETNAAPRLKLAETLLALGRVDEAALQYQRVLDRNPDSALATVGLAKVANARGNDADAASLLERATKDPATRRAAHRLLINAYQRLGRTNEASRISQALAELPNDKPSDPFLAQVEELQTGEQAWIDRADEWIKSGRPAEAAQLLEKAVQSYPKSDRAMFHLGRARLRLGNLAGAETMLVQAVALAPSSVEAQMELGIVRLRRGRTKEALPCFRAAIQAKPNLAEAWYNLALSLGTDAGRQDSITAFREAIRLKPGLIEAYLGLAVALRADGQNQAAADELRRALALQPPEPLRRRLLDQLKLAQQP